MRNRLLLSMILVASLGLVPGAAAWEEPSFEDMERFQEEQRIYHGKEQDRGEDARVEEVARRPLFKGNFNQRLRGMLKDPEVFGLSSKRASAIIKVQDRYHQGDSLHHRRNWCLGGINRSSFRHAAADTKSDARRYYADVQRWVDLLTRFEVDEVINQARMQREIWGLLDVDQKRLFLENGGLLDGILGKVISGHSKDFRMHNVLRKAMGKQWVESAPLKARIEQLTVAHGEYKKTFFAEKGRWERIAFYAWDVDDDILARALQPMAAIQAELYLLATRDLRELYQLFTEGQSSQAHLAAIERAIDENWKAEVKKRFPLVPQFLTAIGVRE